MKDGNSGKQMQLPYGNSTIPVVHDPLPTIYADVLQELWVGNDVMAVTLATVIRDGGAADGHIEAAPQVRLRIPIIAAEQLHPRLGDVLQKRAAAIEAMAAEPNDGAKLS